MPEPTDEILPSTTPEAPKQADESPSQEPLVVPQFPKGFIARLSSFFQTGRQRQIEADPRYRNIVQKKVDLWQKSHPDIHVGSVFVQRRENNQIEINPEIERFIPNLKQISFAEFKTFYPADAAKYEAIQAETIYQDPSLDPEIQKLNEQAIKEQGKPFFTPTPTRPEGSGQISSEEQVSTENSNQERDDSTATYREFVKRYPEKAKAYQSSDPQIKKAYQEHVQEEWSKKTRGQKLFSRLYDPGAIPDAERKKWLSTRVDARAQAVSGKAAVRYQNSTIGRGMSRVNTATEKTVKTVLRPVEYVESKVYGATDYTIGQATRPLKWLRGRAATGSRSVLNGSLRTMSRFMPGFTGLMVRGVGGALQIGSKLLREGFGGVTRLAGELLKGGMRYGAKVTTRLAAGAAAATMPAWGPYAIGAGIVGFIILLIIIILMGALGTIYSDEIMVSVEKSGPTEVENPVAGEPNEITYTIDVGYSGPVTGVTVIDTLPPGTEYVSSTGPVEPTVVGNVVTWTIGTGGGGGTLGGPSNLDTFDQAYFSSLGFPSPSDSITLSAEGLQRWDAGAGAAVLKAAGLNDIDPGLIGAWSFFEGINYDQAVDNCDDGRNGEDTNALTRCGNTSNWQVGGVGIRPSEQLGVLAEAFEAMYGSSDASTVQRVGQDVYTKIGRSGTFPSISAAQAASSFGSNPDLAGDLMRDYQIGAYILAKLFKSYGNNVASTMEGWSATYYNRQKYINWVNALYEAR